jgi:hypothetical protein
MMNVKVVSALAAMFSLASFSASSDSLDTLRSGLQVKIVNESLLTIREIYFSRTNTGWGHDRLGPSTLQPGHHLNINALGAGPYDLRLIDEYGDACDVWNLSISRNRTVTLDTDQLLRCQGYN